MGLGVEPTWEDESEGSGLKAPKQSLSFCSPKARKGLRLQGTFWLALSRE